MTIRGRLTTTELRVATSWALVCLAIHATIAHGALPPTASLFDRSDVMTLELRARFSAVVGDRYGESAYNAAELTYFDVDQAAVVLPVEIRTRGKTRRRKDICAFPPLRMRFGAGVAGTPFDGQGTLKLVTHCNDKDSNDQYVLQEYLAYRIYNLLTERGHRVRLARITYLESDVRVLTARYGIFLEDWQTVAARNGLSAAEVDGGVNIDKLGVADANRVAVFQYMIGNDDWSMLWPEPDEDCCHNTKPMLAPDGTVVPLPYDFDFAGIVNAPYALAKGGSGNVRMRRFGGLCTTAADIPASLEQFQQQRDAIYALYRDQAEVDARHRRSTLQYLDNFYRVISDPVQVERRMIRRCHTD